MQVLAPCAAAVAALALATSLSAQSYQQDFESLTATPAGTLLTGQDGFYIPPSTTSTDFLVHTYAGNTVGVTPNPNGGAVFVSGTGPAGNTYARAQRAFAFASNDYTLGFDIFVHFAGTLPTAQNAGSVSLQPGTVSSFIALARWTDVNTATNWNADFIYSDAAGTSTTASVPDPAFQNLAVDQWYRWEIDFDFGTNAITELRLFDRVTGAVATHAPSGWYMVGGAVTATLPTDFRLFAGGSVAGNMLAFDNLAIGRRGTYDTYGSGCAGSNGTPAVDAAPGARPRIGQTFEAVLSNLPSGGSAVFNTLGFSNTNWGPLPLPYSLANIGMPGCSALAEVVFVLQQTATGATATFSLPIPNDPNLVGVDFYHQAIVTDSGANALGLTVSNGGHGRIGS